MTIDRSRFGGEITEEDYGKYTTIKDVADQMAEDAEFDEKCRCMMELRDSDFDEN